MMQRIIALLLSVALLLSLSLPAVAEVVEPWLTRIVDGMVTANLPKPDIRDDFFLNVNYERLRDTAMPAGHAVTGGTKTSVTS